MAEGITKRKRANGTTAHRVTWRDGGNRDGQSQSETFDREADAKAFRAQLIANGYRRPAARTVTPPASTAVPVLAPATGPLFADYGRARIAALTGVGPGWRADNLRDLNRHMAPAFGWMPLAEIDDTTVRAWLRGMETGDLPWLDGPLAPRTRRRLVTQAGAIMAAAVTDRLAERNPFRGVRIGRSDHDRHDEQVVLDHDEWQLLRAHLPDGPARACADLAVATGARWGELTALAVGHIVEVPGKHGPLPAARVTRSWQRDENGGHRLGPTKSRRSRRTISFDAGTRAVLAPHMAGRHADGLLFTSARGERLHPSNFLRRVWQPALDAAAVQGLGKRPRFHDLRHTHVSWLIAANVPLAVIQRRLGHESITTTIDTYGHMLPAAEAEAVSAIEVALGRPVDDAA